MTMLRYISHPDVAIEPDIGVPLWSLSNEGRRRAIAMLDQPWVGAITRVVSSDEVKARETAALLADHLGLAIEVRSELGEIDRSSTGFVPEERHSDLAARLFAEPHESADGWERAGDAQRRVVAAVADLVAWPKQEERSSIEHVAADEVGKDVAVVGHGGVGTLLYCHLAQLPISQRHDQPGQGHFWSYDRLAEQMMHGWLAIDDLWSTGADGPELSAG